MRAPEPLSRNILPLPDQRLLLEAGLHLDRARAAAAWKAWRQTNSVQDVLPAETRILPLVFKNLPPEVLGNDYITLKGIYRRNIYKNNIMFSRVREITARFQQNRIPVLFLKGTALLAGDFYPDKGLRYMSDIDMLVHPEHLKACCRIFLRQGWKSRKGNIHAWSLYNRKDCIVDLHSNSLPVNWSEEADRELWETSVQNSYVDFPVRIPDAPRLLVHTLIHGCSFSPTVALQWTADSVMICRHAGSALDWHAFLHTVETRRVQAKIRPMLSYLHNSGWIDVPDFVRQKLRRAKLSRWERLDAVFSFYSYLSPRNLTYRGRGIRRHFLRVWLEYRCLISRFTDDPSPGKIRLTVRFLKYFSWYVLPVWLKRLAVISLKKIGVNKKGL